jgi:hypothetical protein
MESPPYKVFLNGKTFIGPEKPVSTEHALFCHFVTELFRHGCRMLFLLVACRIDNLITVFPPSWSAVTV